MLHFSKVLHVENRGFLYFSFKCTNSPENKKCVVQVWTESAQCHDFLMEEKNGSWKMVQTPLPPQWIVQLEAQLETVICNYQLLSPAVPSKFRLWHWAENPRKTGS
jgi:hypothetical protein